MTAQNGAAVRDIINVAKRRNPYVQLILYPALVQGEGAVKSIIRGIRMLEQQGVDVMSLAEAAEVLRSCGRLTKKRLHVQFLNVPFRSYLR